MKFKFKKAIACIAAFAAIVLSVGSIGFASAKAEADERQEVLPIARYDFSDAENPGKDSSGHGYDLIQTIHAKDGNLWTEEGNAGMGTVKDGVLELSGADALSIHEKYDFSEQVNGFTLNFRVKDDVTDNRGQMKCIVGFGYDFVKGTGNERQILGFYTKNDINASNAKRRLYLFMTHVATDSDNPWSGSAPYIFEFNPDEFANVTLSIQPGGKGYVKVNDTVIDLPFNSPKNSLAQGQADGTIPSDWCEKYLRAGNDKRFCIGANVGYGKAYHGYKGWVDDVTVYDFAATKEETEKYWTNGYKLYDTDISDARLITSVEETPVFVDGKITKNEIKDTHTEVQMLKRINDAHIEVHTKDKKTKVELPVTWTSVKEEDGKFIARGTVKNVGISYPCVAELVDVSVEVPVTRTQYDVSVSQTIEGGKVTTDKEKAIVGETVTFTVTPDEGYEIDKVTVNGNEITADNGVYHAEMTSEGMQVSATFKKKVQESEESGCGAAITGTSIALGCVVIAGAVAVLLIKKRKRS